MGRTQRKRIRKKNICQEEEKNEENFHDEPATIIDSSIVELLKWLGIKTQLQLFHFPHTGRGLRTHKLIRANDNLISVPLNKMITRAVIQHKYPSHWSTQLMLSCFLAQDFHWSVYHETLPKSYDVPFYDCPQDDLIEELPSFLKQKIKDQRNIILKQYEKCKTLIPNFQKFTWAWFTVNTRGVYFPDCHDNLALAPFLDMFNHHANVKVDIEIQSDQYVIKSLDKHWQKYQQVFINYGPHDNTKLYVEYGFVIPDHPYDCVPLTFEDILSTKSTPYEDLNKKFEFLNDNRLVENLKLFNSTEEELVSWSVLACLYILNQPNLNNLAKVFEEDLQIKNFQAEIILLIKHQLSGIQRAQQKCCQQSSISTKVLPVLLQIYKRLCEQCLIQVKNL